MFRRKVETKKQELERRIKALEAHIQDIEGRYSSVENSVNTMFANHLEKHHNLPPAIPEPDVQ